MLYQIQNYHPILNVAVYLGGVCVHRPQVIVLHSVCPPFPWEYIFFVIYFFLKPRIFSKSTLEGLPNHCTKLIQSHRRTRQLFLCNVLSVIFICFPARNMYTWTKYNTTRTYKKIRLWWDFIRRQAPYGYEGFFYTCIFYLRPVTLKLYVKSIYALCL